MVRTAVGLQGFLAWLETAPAVNEVVLGRMVATAALARQRSLGAHYRADDVTGNAPEGLARVI